MSDIDSKAIRKGAELTILFSSLDNVTEPDPFGGALPKRSVDWEWLGPEITVSAALVAFKTEQGNLAFQRFLCQVGTQRAKPKG